MKQLFLLLLLLGGVLPPSQAQTFQKARAYMHGFSLGLGYNQTTFINSQFGQMLKEGVIQRRFGHSINTRIVASPIIFDLNFYASRFRVENNPDPRWTYPDTSRIWHAGAEIGFSMPVLLTARHVVPYLGLAYHNGFLGVNTDVIGEPLEDIAADETSSTKISEVLWKAGVILNLGRRVSVHGEYKRSLKATSQRAYSQFNIVFAYRFLFKP